MAAFGVPIKELLGRIQPKILLGRDSKRSPEDITWRVDGVGVPGSSRPDQMVCVFDSSRIKDAFGCASALVVIADQEIQKSEFDWANFPGLVAGVADPYVAFARISAAWAQNSGFEKRWVEQMDFIHPSASIAWDAVIAPGVCIEEGVLISSGVHIGPGCSIGRGSKIGSHSVLFSGVHVYPLTQIGERTRIHSGTVIGTDGFGYAQDVSDNAKVIHEKIHHIGWVEIGDDCEIGANSCIDRGTIGATKILSGAKIDNLVQIGHNCVVGEGAVICGAAGLAGSVTIGRFAMIGGGVGISNGVAIGDFAKVMARSGVNKDVLAHQMVGGYPARDIREFRKLHIELLRLVRKRDKSE